MDADQIPAEAIADTAEVIRTFHWWNYGLDELSEIPPENADYATELAEQIVRNLPAAPAGPRTWALPDGARPFDELGPSGLLWLINRVVFHPRGFALALVRSEGQVVGWKLLGDGREVWRFNGDEDQHFADVAETFRVAGPLVDASGDGEQP